MTLPTVFCSIAAKEEPLDRICTAAKFEAVLLLMTTLYCRKKATLKAVAHSAEDMFT